MILMKINEKNQLDIDSKRIKELIKKFDEGDRSEEAKEAYIFSLIFDFGYESAVMDFEEIREKIILMLSGAGGNA